jgi:hypothetical protein
MPTLQCILEEAYQYLHNRLWMHHLDIHLYFVHFLYLYPHLLFLVYIYNKNYIIIALYHGNSIEVNIMKRKNKQWWSTIPPISTKRKIISHLKSLSIKKTLPYDVDNLGRYIWICGGAKPIDGISHLRFLNMWPLTAKQVNTNDKTKLHTFTYRI